MRHTLFITLTGMDPGERLRTPENKKPPASLWRAGVSGRCGTSANVDLAETVPVESLYDNTLLIQCYPRFYP
jgi:hypothetical protein